MSALPFLFLLSGSASVDALFETLVLTSVRTVTCVSVCKYLFVVVGPHVGRHCPLSVSGTCWRSTWM